MPVPPGCAQVVDASSVQDDIDYDALVTAGTDDGPVIAVVSKVIEGNADVPDARFLRNATETVRVGLGRGFYAFVHPDEIHARDAQDEAERCVRQMDRVGGVRVGQDVVAQDSEDHTPLVGEPYVRWLVDWADRFEEIAPVRTGIYVGGPYWATHASKTVSAELLARVAERWLWSPAYVDSLDAYVASPFPFWMLRQIGGDVAPKSVGVLHVPVIGGGKRVIDRDLYRGSRADWDAWVASLDLRNRQTLPEATPDGASAHGLEIDRQKQIAGGDDGAKGDG